MSYPSEASAFDGGTRLPLPASMGIPPRVAIVRLLQCCDQLQFATVTSLYTSGTSRFFTQRLKNKMVAEKQQQCDESAVSAAASHPQVF